MPLIRTFKPRIEQPKDKKKDEGGKDGDDSDTDSITGKKPGAAKAAGASARKPMAGRSGFGGGSKGFGGGGGGFDMGRGKEDSKAADEPKGVNPLVKALLERLDTGKNF